MRIVFLPIGDVTDNMVSECLETSTSSLRVSNKGNTLLKYEGTKPTSLSTYEDVSLVEAKEVLTQAEWGIA